MRLQPSERTRQIRQVSKTTVHYTSNVTMVAVRRAWRETSRIWRLARTFVRDYTALSVVIVGAVMVSLLNLRVGAADDSIVARVFGDVDDRYVRSVAVPTVTRNLALAPLPMAPVHDGAQPGVPVQGDMPGYAGAGHDAAVSDVGDIEIYTVRQGDTIGQIAKDHGVTINTILWANEIDDVAKIKPGDTIIILATNGVQHTVVAGDTVESIAKKYKGDPQAIISFNGLPANGELTVGGTVTIPDGIKDEIAPKPVTPVSQYALERRTYTSINVAKQVAVSRSYFGRPLGSYVRTQGLHRTNAIDMGTPVGSTVMAAAEGTVVIARGGWNGGYGNYVVIDHPNGTKTLYAHNSRLLVRVGDKVGRGQAIAKSGSTGRSTGPHLHFEVRGARNPF